MNKCNYINSLGTTKHMFIIVKPLTNQEQLILEVLEMLGFFNQFLNTYLGTSIIILIISIVSFNDKSYQEQFTTCLECQYELHFYYNLCMSKDFGLDDVNKLASEQNIPPQYK